MLQWHALLTSLVIETLIVILLFRRLGVKLYYSIVASVVATCLTHPFAWNLSKSLSSKDYDFFLFAIEFCVVMVEIFALKLIAKVTWSNAIIASVIANATSYLTYFFLFKYSQLYWS